MVEIILKASPALGGVNYVFANCTLTERADIALISVAVPHGGNDALSSKLSALWQLAIPGPTQTSKAGEMRAIPLSADQFMLAFIPGKTLSETAAEMDLAGVAYTTMQTDAWVILELSGNGSIAALERICQLDLDLHAFPVDAAARTVMEHLGALILRVEADRFWLMSARSSAGSFLHAVETSCRWTDV